MIDVYACARALEYVILTEWMKNVALQHVMENEMHKWAQKSARSSEQVAVIEAQHNKIYKAEKETKQNSKQNETVSQQQHTHTNFSMVREYFN